MLFNIGQDYKDYVILYKRYWKLLGITTYTQYDLENIRNEYDSFPNNNAIDERYYELYLECEKLRAFQKRLEQLKNLPFKCF